MTSTKPWRDLRVAHAPPRCSGVVRRGLRCHNRVRYVVESYGQVLGYCGLHVPRDPKGHVIDLKEPRP